MREVCLSSIKEVKVSYLAQEEKASLENLKDHSS